MTNHHSGWERRVATLAALVGVNAVGISGQAMWAYVSLGHSVALAGGFAAVLESVALYLTSQASAAMLANDKAGMLRLGAYGFGVLTGAMNYAAHCGPHYAPTALALAFGLLSALSPWLWAIYSRRIHRDQLRADGLIDPRTVKIPTALWLRRPGYSWALWSLGVTTGTNHLPTLRKMLAESQYVRELDGADAVGYAFGVVGTDPHAARVWLAERGVRVTQATLDAAGAGRGRHVSRDTADGGRVDVVPPGRRRRSPGRVTPKGASAAERVAAARVAMPGASVRQVAQRAGVSTRTVQRYTGAGSDMPQTVSGVTASAVLPAPSHVNGAPVLGDLAGVTS